MGSVKKETIEGFNEYLKSLKEGDAADDTEFNFLQFNSFRLEKINVSTPVKEVADLSDDTYKPAGWTPLIDAACKTIKAVAEAVAGSDKKVVICIHTDGEENASKEYKWTDLNELIKEKEALGWQFNFMGVGIDAYDQGQKMGISAGSTVSATLDANQMKYAYKSMGLNTARYASGMIVNTAFSDADKAGAGDYTATGKPLDGGTAGKKPAAPSLKVKSKPTKIVDDFKLTK